MKQYARRVVSFDDTHGQLFHGLWCAKITLEEECMAPTEYFADIQSDAKLSGVAIPLWYVVGNESPIANHYCVITNWWKYRMADGTYQWPKLDPSLYEAKHSQDAPYQVANEEDLDHLLRRASTCKGHNNSNIDHQTGIL